MSIRADKPSLLPHIKWVMVAGVLLLLIVWVVSMRLSMSVHFGAGKAAVVSAGRVGVMQFEPAVGQPVRVDIHRTEIEPQWWVSSFQGPLMRMLSVPLWPVIVVAAGVAAFMFKRDAARKRAWIAGRRLCATCGYDRAGLAAGLRCPECGQSAA